MQQDFIVLAKKIFIKLLKYLKEIYNKQDKNKFRDNFKHLIYYTLLQIVYIDNYYRIYQYLK